ncbi:hypothetical protein [Acinetobacter sp. YK3]|uniref:hypothetical protein n=1 Tax=Acinetobacter sp. YK3 TaxID=1860097 RepID=UPI00084C4F9E|nr:hypothetical protein [Acinetobacter sp. YK3]OEC92721.1 hypothetical protein A9Z07_00085 [Acinetobacter sp. YK3]
MQEHNFLVTYSVKGKTPRQIDQDKAADVRNALNNLKITNWTKLKDVETVFSGILSLNFSTIQSRRNQALRHVSDVFNNVIKQEKASSHVNIYGVFLVDKLGEEISFTV